MKIKCGGYDVMFEVVMRVTTLCLELSGWPHNNKLNGRSWFYALFSTSANAKSFLELYV